MVHPAGFEPINLINPLGEFAFGKRSRGKHGKHKQPLAIYASGRRFKSLGYQTK
jgi:hypothetical protein